MGKKLMLFTDFDGTISTQDFCAAMVKSFAREGWAELYRLWQEKLMSTEECAQRTLELMDVEPEELEAFLKTIDIDPSFLAFVDWAKKKEYPLHILSDGYDNYIKEALNRYGLDIPYYANHMVYEQGWRIQCSYSDEDCKKCGVCKTGLIKRLLKPGYTSVYIGDGYSDLCPAEYCDIVFAKKTLALLCKEEGIEFYPYNDFDDVRKVLEKLHTPL
ncbi:MAG: MtnX-like HAD-IB family phosphatase [Firmicutes bacterium]|nr:MtnX-like HAD-IB family phosphatase [Bacillota bacterium]